MRASKKRLITASIIIGILLIVAFCCKWVNFYEIFGGADRREFVVYSTIMMTIRNIIHISLLLIWCISIYVRILDKRIRNFIISVASLIILWLLVRLVKWEFVMSYDDDIVRYLWYAYYISIILLPLQGVFVADLVGRPEGYTYPRWMDWLYLPAILMITVVFTNDLHNLVFSFPEGVDKFNDIYRHEVLYYIIISWVIVLAMWFIISLLKKSHVSESKGYRVVPFFVVMCFGAVWVIHTFKLFPNDQTLLNCMLITVLLESLIQAGLIRTNSNYDIIFRQSTISAQIVDKKYSPVFSSANAENMDIELFKNMNGGAVQQGDNLLQSKPVAGGFVLWQDNVREINAVLEKLQETREQLGESYELKKAEISIKEQKFQAEEKSRLYDHIAREISPQLEKADEILQKIRAKKTEPRELFAQLCVISAYIKRFSNLLLIAEDREKVAAGELETCMRESVDNLRLAGVIAFLDSKCQGEIAVADAVSVYQLFETIIERSFDKMTAIMILLGCNDGEIFLRIQIGCNDQLECAELTNVYGFGGTITYEVQEEDIVVTAAIKKGGGIR